jgi:hypothetical protein
LNRQEAKRILRIELDKHRVMTYPELVNRFLDTEEAFEVTGPSGASYHVRVKASWDELPDGDLRVVALIHDGGWRQFLPLAQLFIRAPDGSFVGE